jgi:hypothetical protein
VCLTAGISPFLTKAARPLPSHQRSFRFCPEADRPLTPYSGREAAETPAVAATQIQAFSVHQYPAGAVAVPNPALFQSGQPHQTDNRTGNEYKANPLPSGRNLNRTWNVP